MAVWVPKLAAKGFEVFNNYTQFLLVEGARKSGKSISIDHKMVRHAIENDGARIGIITKSKGSGKIGVWSDLTEPGGIIDQWREAGVEYAVPPKYDPDSKMAYFRIRTPPTSRNPKGGEAEFQLHSLFWEEKVEQMFKDSRFSMIYLVEADRFEHKKTFSALRLQLRSLRVPENRHQMILDTNPPELGTDHWLHDVFFKAPDKNMATIHFGIDDNPFLSASEKQGVYDAYKHDKNLLDRYYYGKWVKASAHGVFADVFLPNIHIQGELPADADLSDYESRDDWEILRPHPSCRQFEEGWDIGDVNLGYVMGIPRYHERSGTLCYDIVDELVYTNTRHGLDFVVDEVLERREYWQDWHTKINGIPGVRWTSWSDSSSMRHRIGINGSEAMEISRLSNRRIHLGGVRKGSGSIGRRKDLLKRLLFEQRIYVSAICKQTIAMLKYIQSKPNQPIALDSPHKHVFDALTYMLGYGIPENTGRTKRNDDTPAEHYSITL
jgi:hypothetical protein